MNLSTEAEGRLFKTILVYIARVCLNVPYSPQNTIITKQTSHVATKLCLGQFWTIRHYNLNLKYLLKTTTTTTKNTC